MQTVNKWDEELARLATEATASLPTVSGEWLSTKGGHLSYRGQQVPGDKMNVVVLDFLNENQYYDAPFDPAMPASPCCYAFGQDKGSMAPHAKAATPQNKTCKGCPHMEWGSADRGKGKACREVLRLALIPAVSTAAEIKDCEVAYLKVPVMSVKNFSAMAQQVAQTLKRPPFAVVTEIHVTSDNQVSVFFKVAEAIEDGDLLSAIMEKRKEAALDNPYPEIEAAPAPKTPARNRFRK